MIHSKQDLKEYIAQDALACGRDSLRARLVGDETWQYQLTLRKCEYYHNLQGLKRKISTPARIFHKFLYYRRSARLGISLPLNVFDKGLSVPHFGTIIVNQGASIGKNCRIHSGVNIGATGGSDHAARIGNNVYIGPGVKIVGDITIADDVCLGAGAVVVKSITEPGTTWAGVPARKISDHDSHGNLNPALFL